MRNVIHLYQCLIYYFSYKDFTSLYTMYLQFSLHFVVHFLRQFVWMIQSLGYYRDIINHGIKHLCLMEIKLILVITKNVTYIATNDSVYMPVGTDGIISESNIFKVKSTYIVVHMLSQGDEMSVPISFQFFLFFYKVKKAYKLIS